jgi:hypothetical protein
LQTADRTEVRFTSFLSSGFITAIIVNPPERKLAKCTPVFNFGQFWQKRYYNVKDKRIAITGKSLSEALILASTNSQYEDRLSMELPVQYMKTTSSEHVAYTNCFLI